MGSLTLTGTVNPDFGQVEADPAVVNLGAFETFFAERRPFFVEGSGNFSFNIDCNDGQCTGLVLFAPHRPVAAALPAAAERRLCRAANQLDDRGRGEADRPRRQVLDRRASGDHHARGCAPHRRDGPAGHGVAGGTGDELHGRAREPRVHQSVAALLRHDEHEPAPPGELAFLPAHAVTGGMEGDWRLAAADTASPASGRRVTSPDRRAAIDRLQRSNVHSFQRPDATHLTYDPTRTSLAGYAGAVNFNKISGQTTRFSSNVSFKSPGFDINDLGFQQRADEITQSNWFQIRSDRPTRLFRARNINFNQWAGWNAGGELSLQGPERQFALTRSSATGRFGGGLQLQRQRPDRSDDARRPGGALERLLQRLDVREHGQSEDRLRQPQLFGVLRPLQLARLGLRPLGDGAAEPRAVPLGRVRFRPQQFRFAVGLERRPSTAGHAYVFARIDQTTVSVSARLNYTMSPTLSLQIYARPFVSAGDYTNFKELADGRAKAYADRYAPFAYAGQPDFNFRSFRTTNVLRWEYRPGSALFVVWQQGRDEFAQEGLFNFGHDFGRALDAPATNLFLIKISHWLNL